MCPPFIKTLLLEAPLRALMEVSTYGFNIRPSFKNTSKILAPSEHVAVMLHCNRAHGKACPNPPRAFALLLGEIDADAESERKTFDFALFGRPARSRRVSSTRPARRRGSRERPGPATVAMTFGTLAPPPADAPPDEALAYSKRALEMLQVGVADDRGQGPRVPSSPARSTPRIGSSVTGRSSPLAAPRGRA